LTNIVDLNKNQDFFNPNLLPKEENLQPVLSSPFIDSKGAYIMGNMHPNMQSMQQAQMGGFPFQHFDSRYPQMPYPNNTQLSLGYPQYSFDNRFNPTDLSLNNKMSVNPNFDINKQNPEDGLAQRNNVGVNFMPNINLPMVGYPLYSQGYPDGRMNVVFFHFCFF